MQTVIDCPSPSFTLINQVNEIMSSELSERYAFIEHRESLDDNKQEIKINKKYSDEDFQRKEAILLRNDKPWYAEQEGDFLDSKCKPIFDYLSIRKPRHFGSFLDALRWTPLFSLQNEARTIPILINQ